MGFNAVLWAQRQTVGNMAAKALLNAYASWSAESYSTWATNETLMLGTEMELRTLRKARSLLVEKGFLVETPARKGETRNIVVYQMLCPPGAVVLTATDARGEVENLSPPTAEQYQAMLAGAKGYKNAPLDENGGKGCKNVVKGVQKRLQRGANLHPNKEDKKDKEDKDNGDKSPSPQNRVGKRDASIAFLVAQGVDEQHAADWLTARKGKEVTATAWTRLCNQAALAGLTPAQAVEYAAGASWVGFEAEWFAKGQGQAPRLTGRQQVTQGAARAIFDFDEGGQQAPRLTGNDEGVIDV